ncbi:PREDICTED: uncharacterized protein KIAA1614 homolog [Tinamus guttatus]|uniref:uncharacterized protein KIAA1614 homolog n=1 Tax=Tinamus guttatus TaxID=94827 RepID=UPI00052EFC63|nr:PREDICTED: uncharacterized protein KIAA1614 homolog [Tinamus guttatus]
MSPCPAPTGPPVPARRRVLCVPSSSDAGSTEKRLGEREEVSAPPLEPKARTLGSGGSPLWILPSRQRIHTERIKETYIGDVTCVDDVDSALESTDTSDGCRTDSEEGGPRGRHPSAHGHLRPHSHDAPVAGKPQRERHGADGRRDVRRLSGSAGPKASANGPEVPSPCVAPLPVSLRSTGGHEAVVGPRRAPSLQPGLEPPVLGAPGRGHSPAPCRKAGGPRDPSPEPVVPAERPSPCSTRHLPGSPLGALSTNNCNNTQGRALGGGQPRRTASVQSLQSLLAKAPRASAYLVPKPGDGLVPPASSKGGPAPRRSLSLEDIGAPDLPRAVGRVIEVFPDGTSQLELRRPPDGTFGFRLASGHGRPDSGVYVQEMADAGTAKLYAGLLAVGDEILQVNGAAVSRLAPAQLHELLLRADTLSLRVMRQRPPRR